MQFFGEEFAGPDSGGADFGFFTAAFIDFRLIVYCGRKRFRVLKYAVTTKDLGKLVVGKGSQLVCVFDVEVWK